MLGQGMESSTPAIIELPFLWLERDLTVCLDGKDIASLPWRLVWESNVCCNYLNKRDGVMSCRWDGNSPAPGEQENHPASRGNYDKITAKSEYAWLINRMRRHSTRDNQQDMSKNHNRLKASQKQMAQIQVLHARAW